MLDDESDVAVITERDGYLHAEYTSRLFRFVDDVEFHAPESDEVVHLRSASRVGRGDMGANRRRMEQLRERLRARGLVR